MDEKFDKAIDILVGQLARPGANTKPDEALKISQATLNLAHAKNLMEGKSGKKQGPGA